MKNNQRYLMEERVGKRKCKKKTKSTTKKEKLNKLHEHKKQRRKKRNRQIMKELGLAIGLGCVITLFVSSFFLGVVSVRGFGMVATLREGDKVVIRKRIVAQRFDIIAFSHGENEEQIRRVIGLPGEKISYKQDRLYVNGLSVDEKFLIDEINESQKNGRNYTEDFEEVSIIVPENYYFVLGDNRPYATDSRHYGIISKEKIIGKVCIQLFPFNEIKSF